MTAADGAAERTPPADGGPVGSPLGPAGRGHVLVVVRGPAAVTRLDAALSTARTDGVAA